MSDQDLRYPIGAFKAPTTVSEQDLANWIYTVKQFPAKLQSAVKKLTNAQLDTPCRDGGWTVRQVIHHMADSHMNSYIRFKLALTEDNPTIKPYHEDRWAELPDAKTGDIEMSLMMIESLHTRWVFMLRNIQPSEWSRTFFHPERKTSMRLDTTLALYAWHCDHHLTHVTNLKERMKW
jgi:hypothetical protein